MSLPSFYEMAAQGGQPAFIPTSYGLRWGVVIYPEEDMCNPRLQSLMAVCSCRFLHEIEGQES